MNSIYSFLAGKMNYIILVLGFGLLVLLVGNLVKLRWHYSQIKATLNWTNTRSVLNKNTKEIESVTNSENVTPDTIRELQTEFNKTCSRHEAYSQLIPLFPLFGILGTVSGLILELQASSIDEMFNSLDTALSTTFWGLVFAIILKSIDAVGPAKTINATDIILDDYDKKFNTAIKLGNIEE